MRVDLDGLQILDEDQCRALVLRVQIGRIALTHRAMPLIMPVTFALTDTDLILSVGAGVVADAAEQAQVVCFQADWADQETMAAWSVSVIGQLSLLEHEVDIRHAQQLDIKPWSCGELRYARLTPEFTTGRARGISF